VKRSWRSRIQVEVGDDGVVSLAGASLLTTTARVLGLARGLSKRLSPWTPVGATHDTGKIVFDLAVALGVGGDCPADVAVLRGQPRLFGAVASDATVSRRVDLLAADVDDAVAAIRGARMQARGTAVTKVSSADGKVLSAPATTHATVDRYRYSALGGARILPGARARVIIRCHRFPVPQPHPCPARPPRPAPTVLLGVPVRPQSA